MSRFGGGPTGLRWQRRAAGPAPAHVLATLIAALIAALAAVRAIPVDAQSPPRPSSAPTAATTSVASADPTALETVNVDEAEVIAVARRLNCPICQGRNLVECPLPVCAEMRDEIRARLAAGADRAAIIQHFVDYYGPAVRNTPPISGLLGLAWWVPMGLLVVGAWLVVRIVRPGVGSIGALSAGQGDLRSHGRASAGPDDRTTARADARLDSGTDLTKSPGPDSGYAAEFERLAAERDRGAPR